MTRPMVFNVMAMILAGMLAGGCASVRMADGDIRDPLPEDPSAKTDVFTTVSMNDLFNARATGGDAGFDGWGNAYPAELLFNGGGKWQDDGVPFTLPDYTQQPTNVVVAAGQVRRVLPPSAYSALHILAAAVNGDQQASLQLTYANGLEQAEVAVSDWCGDPSFGERVVGAWDRVEPEAHEAATCRVFRVTIPLDSGRLLTAIGLPDHSDMRIFAMTLER